jgi:hypothetical protein
MLLPAQQREHGFTTETQSSPSSERESKCPTLPSQKPGPKDWALPITNRARFKPAPPALQGTRRHDGNGKDIHRIREEDILDFVRNHPQEFNLGKVDQTWFLDLVLLKGREVPEVKSPGRAETEEEDTA